MGPYVRMYNMIRRYSFHFFLNIIFWNHNCHIKPPIIIHIDSVCNYCIRSTKNMIGISHLYLILLTFVITTTCCVKSQQDETMLVIADNPPPNPVNTILKNQGTMDIRERRSVRRPVVNQIRHASKSKKAVKKNHKKNVSPTRKAVKKNHDKNVSPSRKAVKKHHHKKHSTPSRQAVTKNY